MIPLEFNLDGLNGISFTKVRLLGCMGSRLRALEHATWAALVYRRALEQVLIRLPTARWPS